MKRLLCVVFALALCGAASAGDWQIDVVDSVGDVGLDTSLALDSSGYPHISYWAYINHALKYALWDGVKWKTELLDLGGMGYGEYTSLALDCSDHPYIAFCSSDNTRELMCAHFDGDAWQVEPVDVNNTCCPSLALDCSGYPHIAYCSNNESTELKYAWWDGAAWQVETVDSTGYVIWNPSLALDSSGYPCIAYTDGSNDDLKFARWDGAAWRFETVDSSGDVGYWISLALDSSDKPHISYRNIVNCALKYTWWDGAAWETEIVDSSCEVGLETSLALDSRDYPHISYRDWSRDSFLKYARWTGSAWQIDTVDLCGDVGYYNSLALDASDNPHISFYNCSDHCLYYAYCDLGPGVEGAEVFADAGGEGVLVGWTITGETPAGVRVLRSAGEDEPVAVSGALPGAATRWLDTDVKAGVEYCYWLETTDADGTVSRFGPTEPVVFNGSARMLALSVYPSPASGAFTIDYTLPENGRISISLYDLSGRRVSTVFDGETAAGRHGVSFDASALPPGVYLARLVTNTASLTHRVVVAR